MSLSKRHDDLIKSANQKIQQISPTRKRFWGYCSYARKERLIRPSADVILPLLPTVILTVKPGARTKIEVKDYFH